MTETNPSTSPSTSADDIRRRGTATDPSMLCRMPKPLFDYIDQSARRNGRSRNSELLERLWRTVLQEDGTPATEGQ